MLPWRSMKYMRGTSADNRAHGRVSRGTVMQRAACTSLSNKLVVQKKIKIKVYMELNKCNDEWE